MKTWAEELENSSKIKVNSIDPGPVRTSFRRRSHPGESQDSLIAPQKITPAYLKLMSGDHNLHGASISLQESLDHSNNSDIDTIERMDIKH